MTRRGTTTFAICALLALAWPTTASADDAGPLLDRVRARVAALADASFLLQGAWTTVDGARLSIELDVRLKPDEEAISVYVLQPDALADDIVVLQGDDLFVYSFLVNQVTIYDVDDPAALSGLLGQTVDPFETVLDVDALLDAYVVTLLGTSPEGAYGPTSTIELSSRDANATFPKLHVGVADALSVPYSVEIFDRDDQLVGSFTLDDLLLDAGLTLSDVTYLPGDAEILDERRD